MCLGRPRPQDSFASGLPQIRCYSPSCPSCAAVKHFSRRALSCDVGSGPADRPRLANTRRGIHGRRWNVRNPAGVPSPFDTRPRAPSSGSNLGDWLTGSWKNQRVVEAVPRDPLLIFGPPPAVPLQLPRGSRSVMPSSAISRPPAPAARTGCRLNKPSRRPGTAKGRQFL